MTGVQTCALPISVDAASNYYIVWTASSGVLYATKLNSTGGLVYSYNLGGGGGSPASQTITFNALSNQAFGTATFTVSATASSGLPVSFNSQTPLVCTVSGATVTLVSAGTCTIQATQAGNGNYAAATPVSQSFQVTQASQTITFGTLANQLLGTAPFQIGRAHV